MPKFRKRPVVITAEQWFPDTPVAGVEFPVPPDFLEALARLGEKFAEDKCGMVRTLEAPFICWAGDWIITGVTGEKYPCKPDIFEATYEALE